MLPSNRGVCIIAYGTQAKQAGRQCALSVERTNHLPVHIRSEPHFSPIEFTPAQQARWSKVQLYHWSPYLYTCYLDADTHVHSCLTAGFDALTDGWDIVITPSTQQDTNWLWHVSDAEREYTRRVLPLDLLQIQCGVFWFRRNETIRKFFELWQEEWIRFKGEDQGAFLRAFARYPIRMWLLGFPYNGGSIVSHRWGLLRGH